MWIEKLTGVDGVEEIGALLLFFDICVNEEGVGLRMNVFHHDLEAIKAASLGYLDFAAETLNQVFVNNSIRCSEERKNVRDEVSFVVVQSVIPVV